MRAKYMMPGDTTKWCSACQSYKPPEEFYKNKKRPDGLQNYCKPCSKISLAKNDKKNPEGKRKRAYKCYLKRNYGITPEQYAQLLTDQNNLCGICQQEMNGESGTRAHLDHDHVTGQVRSFLCENCNRAIGLFQEAPDRLEQGIAYLKYWKTISPA